MQKVGNIIYPDYNDYCKVKWSDVEFRCVSHDRSYNNSRYQTYVSLENAYLDVQMRVRLVDIVEINGKEIPPIEYEKEIKSL